MDQDEFNMITTQLFMFANLVKDVNLTEYITAIERTDATGPILNPTLWRKAHFKTDIFKKLANGLQKFKQSIPTPEEAKKADLQQAMWEAVE